MYFPIRLGILLLVAAWTFPASASAQWFGSTDGLCSDTGEDDLWATLVTVDAESEGCGGSSLTDPSANACFEGAEHPISTLPHLIAETAAERVTAEVARTVSAMVRQNPPLPSPDEASVEDPHIPGVPLLKAQAPTPRPAPNACVVDPSECEAVPWVPTLEIETSKTFGERHDVQVEVEDPPVVERRPGPANPGVGPCDGVSPRLERPPEVT